MPRIVFFTIHNTTRWWKYLGSQINFAEVTVLSDLRGDGDRSLVDDFYRLMREGDPVAFAVERFGEAGCADIILRCRSLRSLDRDLAMKMIGGMAQAIERAFDDLDPDLVLTFTIDRYVMDVLARTARARNIDFLEMTTSIIPDQVMLMRRGQPIWLREPSDHAVDAAVRVLCKADFAPAYVRNAKKFSTGQFWRVFGYFALRGAYFNTLRFLRRDRFNSHYIDALKRLKHKVRAGDVAALKLLDRNWEARLGEVGYLTFVKDHPLQFGFRQRELFERLSKLPHVTLVPYEVPAGLLIEQCSISVTFTGTVGFQAALSGLCSVVTEPYYATERHFLHIRSFEEIGSLVDRLKQWRPPDDLVAARREIVRHMAAISVEGDYFTWQKFDPENQASRGAVESLVHSLNRYLPGFLKSRKIPA
jgi:hypothetical protein